MGVQQTIYTVCNTGQPNVCKRVAFFLPLFISDALLRHTATTCLAAFAYSFFFLFFWFFLSAHLCILLLLLSFEWCYRRPNSFICFVDVVLFCVFRFLFVCRGRLDRTIADRIWRSLCCDYKYVPRSTTCTRIVCVCAQTIEVHIFIHKNGTHCWALRFICSYCFRCSLHN